MKIKSRFNRVDVDRDWLNRCVARVGGSNPTHPGRNIICLKKIQRFL